MEDNYIELQSLLQTETDDIDLIESEDSDQESDIIENKIETENIQPALRLDYKLKTMEERRELVEKIISATPKQQLTNRYLEILADYIMGALTKEEKKEKLYLTDNRLITINKRETSFEGVIEKFENGEDGIYNLIINDKNVLLTQKNTITDEDIAQVPGLKDLQVAIKDIEESCSKATGRKKYLLKKQLIEMRKDQYILKNAYKPPMAPMPSLSSANKIDLSENFFIDKNGDPQSTGLISFFNPKHISAILCHYNALKLETQGKYWNDFFYLMEDFDKLLERALANYPIYQDIVDMKKQNKSTIEIQALLKEKYNENHSVQFVSSLWRNKIPKLIAETEQKRFLIWYYTNEKPDEWKRCPHCEQLKPANPHFFSKNKTSKDGYYSWCKECRKNKK